MFYLALMEACHGLTSVTGCGSLIPLHCAETGRRLPDVWRVVGSQIAMPPIAKIAPSTGPVSSLKKRPRMTVPCLWKLVAAFVPVMPWVLSWFRATMLARKCQLLTHWLWCASRWQLRLLLLRRLRVIKQRLWAMATCVSWIS